MKRDAVVLLSSFIRHLRTGKATMTTAPTTLIAIPDSVLGAVEDALVRHLEIMRHKQAIHRDEADRVGWAREHYRIGKFRHVYDQVRFALAAMECLSEETQAELNDHIERRQDDMPRSKRNAEQWAARKAELKRQQAALRARRQK